MTNKSNFPTDASTVTINNRLLAIVIFYVHVRMTISRYFARRAIPDDRQIAGSRFMWELEESFVPALSLRASRSGRRLLFSKRNT